MKSDNEQTMKLEWLYKVGSQYDLNKNSVPVKIWHSVGVELMC